MNDDEDKETTKVDLLNIEVNGTNTTFDPLAWEWTVNPSRLKKKAGVVGRREPMSPYWQKISRELLRKFYPANSNFTANIHEDEQEQLDTANRNQDYEK